MTSQITPHLWFPEPKLAFHPERADDVDTHPLRGLLRFGPYSAGLVPDPIRVATIAPAGEGHRLYSFMKELNSEYDPTERKDYLPKWPGFSAAFNLHMRGAAKACHIELDDRLEGEMRDAASPHVVLATRLIRAIQMLEASRDEFDVIFLYVPTSWSPGFSGASGEDSICMIISRRQRQRDAFRSNW